MTSNMSLSELEDRLDEKVKEQNDNAYNLLIAINSRNADRVKEQRKRGRKLCMPPQKPHVHGLLTAPCRKNNRTLPLL